MAEKIIDIQEVSNEKFNGCDCGDGYRITTDKQSVKLLISNDKCCCEYWGYFMSEDNLSRFIGAELLDISLTDTELNTKNHVDIYEGDVMFVNLNTSEGLLQFVAYNDHNGYYGHSACVISEQLNHETTL